MVPIRPWCNVVVAHNAPLSQCQLDVLQWISNGCPDGQWTNFSYKTTAGALAWRRLISVSKRGGSWSAEILPAGVYYLDHCNYPPGHWRVKRPLAEPVVSDIAMRPTATPQRPVALRPPRQPLKPARPRSPDELTPTRKLLKDIIDAGGVLERKPDKDDDTNYRGLVAMINRWKMAPDSQEVILIEGPGYRHFIFRLSAVSDWKTEPPRELAAAERIHRWHPAVSTVRQDNRLSHIDAGLRRRAFIVLESLAREAEVRGYAVRAPKRDSRGYGEQTGGVVGDLVFQVDQISCTVSLTQPNDRVPHVATKTEIERAKRYSWERIPTHDSVKAERLSITLATDSRYESKVTWSDTKTLSIESRLPDVLGTFERWAVAHAERTEAERRAALEKQQRREREDELARENHVQKVLADKLVADLESWELVGRLRGYLAAMEQRIAEVSDPEERTAAVEWLRWGEEYLTHRDPLQWPIGKPTVKPANYAQLQEARQRLGFRDSW